LSRSSLYNFNGGRVWEGGFTETRAPGRHSRGLHTILSLYPNRHTHTHRQTQTQTHTHTRTHTHTIIHVCDVFKAVIMNFWSSIVTWLEHISIVPLSAVLSALLPCAGVCVCVRVCARACVCVCVC